MNVFEQIEATHLELGVLDPEEHLAALPFDRALARYNSMIAEAYGTIAGEKLTDVYISTAANLEPNTRALVDDSVDPTTLTFPGDPASGLTAPSDGARIQVVTSSASAMWFYRADLAQWKLISDLTAEDDSPFPASCDDAVVLGLAQRMAGQYRTALTPEQNQRLALAVSHMRSRYRQSVVVGCDPAVLSRSRQGYTDAL